MAIYIITLVIRGDKIVRGLSMVFKISIQESHVSFSDLDVCKLPGTFQSVVWLEKMFFFSALLCFWLSLLSLTSIALSLSWLLSLRL